MTFEMAPKYRVAWIAFAVCFALDRFTKSLVVDSISYTERIPVLEGFFYLTHVRNAGAAFGILADADPSWRLVFFVGVSILAVGVILVFLRDLDAQDRLSGLALGLIMGGATGNLYDRFRYGEVVDFLHFRLWSGYSWPDFNVADSCIVVGVGILLLELLASEGERRVPPKPDGSSV